MYWHNTDKKIDLVNTNTSHPTYPGGPSASEQRVAEILRQQIYDWRKKNGEVWRG